METTAPDSDLTNEPPADWDKRRLSRTTKVLLVVGLLVVALLAVRFVLFPVVGVQSLQISSDTMQPNINSGDRVLFIAFGETDRGDVVIFDAPDEAPGLSTLLLGRVIGLGGESITFENSIVHIDGEPLDEPYLVEGIPTTTAPGEPESFLIPDDQVFIMGDDRPRSLDSRSYGPVEVETIQSNRHWVWNSAG